MDRKSPGILIILVETVKIIGRIGSMVEEKMTYVLVSTEKFIATLTFPVKSKVIENKSKHVQEVHEFTDAVLEVAPVQHKAEKGKLEDTAAFRFFSILCYPGNMLYSKNKQLGISSFINDAEPKVLDELRSLNGTRPLLVGLRDKADRVIINLVDKAGNKIDRVHWTTVADLLKVVDAFTAKILLRPAAKKIPLFLAPAEAAHEHKERRREKVGETKQSGGTRRYMTGASLKVA